MRYTTREASWCPPLSSKEPPQNKRSSSPLLSLSYTQLFIADRFMSFDSLRKTSHILHSDIHARSSQKDLGRRTIASSFMKSSSGTFSSSDDPVHPLDTIPQEPAGHDLHIDLNLRPPISPRPFGSQDTLVNTFPGKEKNDKRSLTIPSGHSSTHDEELQPQKLPNEEKKKRQCSRRCWVFMLFLSTIGVILLSALFWPRTPLIRIEGASLLSPVKITETNQGAMLGNVQFETQWKVNYTVDNRQNWLLPTRLVQLHVLVKDGLTGNIVGKGGQYEPIVLDPGVISTVALPVALDYQAREGSDTTFHELKKACVRTSEDQESLSLSFRMTLHIWGLDFFGYRPTVIVAPATGGFVCPLV